MFELQHKLDSFLSELISSVTIPIRKSFLAGSELKLVSFYYFFFFFGHTVAHRVPARDQIPAAVVALDPAREPTCVPAIPTHRQSHCTTVGTPNFFLFNVSLSLSLILGILFNK